MLKLRGAPPQVACVAVSLGIPGEPLRTFGPPALTHIARYGSARPHQTVTGGMVLPVGAPDKYVQWMTEHARLNRMGAGSGPNFLTDAIFADLPETCPRVFEGLDQLRLRPLKNRGMGGESYRLDKALRALEQLRAGGSLSEAERLVIDTNIDGVPFRRTEHPELRRT